MVMSGHHVLSGPTHPDASASLPSVTELPLPACAPLRRNTYDSFPQRPLSTIYGYDPSHWSGLPLPTGCTAIAITAGVYHTCALLSNCNVACWGLNGYGQLGIGSTTDVGTSPGQMGSGLQLVHLGAGKMCRYRFVWCEGRCSLRWTLQVD